MHELPSLSIHLPSHLQSYNIHQSSHPYPLKLENFIVYIGIRQNFSGLVYCCASAGGVRGQSSQGRERIVVSHVKARGSTATPSLLWWPGLTTA
jgi:hypothetical protein